MGSLCLWGRSIQKMGGDVVIGRSIYVDAVIDGSLYSQFYSICQLIPNCTAIDQSNADSLFAGLSCAKSESVVFFVTKEPLPLVNALWGSYSE